MVLSVGYLNVFVLFLSKYVEDYLFSSLVGAQLDMLSGLDGRTLCSKGCGSIVEQRAGQSP
eukprot:3488477-Amphidinium_carterae.1